MSLSQALNQFAQNLGRYHKNGRLLHIDQAAILICVSFVY